MAKFQRKPIQYDERGFRKFGWMDKLAYAAGDFGCNMSFALKSTHQTFWLVYMLLDSNLLSILVLITQIWDAINDPLIGSMIDADKHNLCKSCITELAELGFKLVNRL